MISKKTLLTPLRKSGLASETTKARIVRHAINQLPQ